MSYTSIPMSSTCWQCSHSNSKHFEHPIPLKHDAHNITSAHASSPSDEAHAAHSGNAQSLRRQKCTAGVVWHPVHTSVPYLRSTLFYTLALQFTWDTRCVLFMAKLGWGVGKNILKYKFFSGRFLKKTSTRHGDHPHSFRHLKEFLAVGLIVFP